MFGIPSDRRFKADMFASVLLLHIFGVVGFVRLFQYSWINWIEIYALWQISGLGITAGAHRLWAHRSYKARMPLRVVLMILNSIANEGPILWWAKDHRVHHKCSDTEADPHNIQNGFMFAHCGWLFASKTKALYEASATLDYSDLTDDPVVMFQHRMPVAWFIFWGYIAPSIYGYYRIGHAADAFFIYGALRWVCSLNATWCVNSVAHTFGDRPYRDIPPAQNFLTSVLAVGEGWHNYHHTYPFDYKTAELPWFVEINLTTLFIDTMAFVDQAYDLKTKKNPSYRTTIQKGAIENIKPGVLQKQINAFIQSCDTSIDTVQSFNYLLINIVISVGFFIISQKQTYLSKWTYFPVYSYVQGTIWTGLWVIGHECGHGAFANSKWLNDFVGYIIHTCLLVPYFSWQYTHAKHHKFTNHLILGETHVPVTKKGFQRTFGVVQTLIGEDAFPLFQMVTNTLFGWQYYLFLNTSGGRTQHDYTTKLTRANKDHFTPNQLFPKRLHGKVIISTVGLAFFLTMLVRHFTLVDIAYWYIGPYVITNGWLVMYTFLQHTHEHISHFANKEYTFLHGMLSTIDRPYNRLTNFLHHNIGSTHILHHYNYKIPHYRAKNITPKLKKLLQENGVYHYDDRPALLAYYQTLKKCKYVDKIEGIQYYKS